MASAVSNAKRANAVVKKKLSVGPGNRWYSGMGAVLCVKAQRREGMKELNRRAAEIKKKASAVGKGQVAEWAKWEQVIAIWAKNAEKYHCGNCAEHAAVAFGYLKNAGIRPIEYMAFMSSIFEDHGFVVIGRKISTDLNKPLAWGTEVAVCDPYYDKAYPVASIVAQMSTLR